jgi:predicted nicotinamide N-methyase
MWSPNCGKQVFKEWCMPSLASLQQQLGTIIPSAVLEQTTIPDCDGLRLWLLNGDYPQGDLPREAAERIMSNPLYWVFCWASGQVLASTVLREPDWVKGKRVIDFGCGSGVVAIAAKLAGAGEVIACDLDQDALLVTALNAELNGVELTMSDNFDAIGGHVDLVLVADVLYDQGNFVWLQRFCDRSEKVLVADSRVKDFRYPPYRQIARRDSFTIPDLDESAQFRDVRLYLAANP